MWTGPNYSWVNSDTYDKLESNGYANLGGGGVCIMDNWIVVNKLAFQVFWVYKWLTKPITNTRLLCSQLNTKIGKTMLCSLHSYLHYILREGGNRNCLTRSQILQSQLFCFCPTLLWQKDTKRYQSEQYFFSIFLCKIVVQRSKYWLEMSKASERVNNFWITVPLVLDVRIQMNQTGFKIIEKRETH